MNLHAVLYLRNESEGFQAVRPLFADMNPGMGRAVAADGLIQKRAIIGFQHDGSANRCFCRRDLIEMACCTNGPRTREKNHIFQVDVSVDGPESAL